MNRIDRLYYLVKVPCRYFFALLCFMLWDFFTSGSLFSPLSLFCDFCCNLLSIKLDFKALQLTFPVILIFFRNVMSSFFVVYRFGCRIASVNDRVTNILLRDFD